MQVTFRRKMMEVCNPQTWWGRGRRKATGIIGKESCMDSSLVSVSFFEDSNYQEYEVKCL
jgi:hypothetical protein